MKDLAELYNKKEYQKIISETENDFNIDHLYYRLSSFIILGKINDALKLIESNKNILKSRLELLIKTHIEVLIMLGRYQDAHQVLNEYALYPYESQRVEELFRFLPKHIDDEEKLANNNFQKNVSNENIKKILKSKNSDEILYGLELLKDKDALQFLSELSSLLMSQNKQSVKCYALLLLVQKEIDRNLSYNQNGNIITLNPKKLKFPFSDQYFASLLHRINTNFKDPSLAKQAENILASYILSIYPYDITYSQNDMFYALILLTESNIGKKEEEIFEEFGDNIEINKDAIKSIVSEINEHLLVF